MLSIIKRLRRPIKLADLRSPAAKLTFAYVLILSALSIGFSVVLYHFAGHEVADGLRHQYNQFYGPAGPNGPHPGEPDAMNPQVAANIASAQHNLIIGLWYFNAIIVIGGTLLSYWLAKRTLRPIEEALEAQTRFTADASHELRTPLAVMQTEIEIARRDPNITLAEAVELIDSNLEEVGKLRALSEGLLSLARASTKPLTLKPSQLPVILEAAIGRVQAQAKQRSVTINPDTADLVVMAEIQSFTELLVILLDNAIKYSPNNTTVTIKAAKEGSAVVIRVTDQGRGIKPEDIPHIFDRFFRADASRTNQDVEGHGLGLSIAANIARLHKTKIDVASTLGKGTTFAVRSHTS